MPNYKLCYFDIRGLAETARMLFVVSKTPYEDIRLSLTFGTPGDFSTISRPEFDEKKASGELDISLGKVPYLDVDGTKFGQSKAIERYLSKQFSMLGANDLEAAQIDQLCESVIDFKAAYTKAKGTTGDEEKKAALEKFFAETLPDNLKLAEKSLPAAGAGPWLVGNTVSLADVVFYAFLAAPDGFFDNADGAKAAFQGCARIKAAMEAVDAIPELKTHIANRKPSPF
jgi:glutathione S-transferase